MNTNKKFTIRCRGIILHDGKLLLVRHQKAQFVALPGGHLEWGEDVKECMRREILEELGVEPKIGRLLYVNTFKQTDMIQPTEFFFEITNGSDYVNCESLARSHAHEIEEIRWAAPVDDIKIFPRKIEEDFKKGILISDQVRFIRGD